MSPVARAALMGAVAAVLVLALAAGGVWWYLSTSGRLERVERPEEVVVVFVGAAEDGAQVAQLVAVVPADGASPRFADTAETVTVPGSQPARLRDAYPFGGAAAIAAAVATSQRPGWIEVDEPSWRDLVKRAGGLSVPVPRTLDVFTGERLFTFTAPVARVAPDAVAQLMNGAVYLAPSQRRAIAASAGAQSLSALAAAQGSAPAGVQTNLSPEALSEVMKGLAGR